MALAYLIATVLLASVDLGSTQAVGISTETVLSSLSPQQLNIDFGRFIPKFNITDPQALPCKRPMPHKYPTKFQSARYNAYRSPTSDAIIWSYKHEPIKGVTPEMVIWMWQNFNKVVTDPRDGQKYDMYLLMHPTDHIGVEWDTKELVVADFDTPGDGTKWLWSEIPASGCRAVNETTIRCPAKPFTGYTCKTKVAELNRRPTLNMTMHMAEFRTRGPGPRVVRMRYFFNIKDTGIVQTDQWATFVEFRHEFRAGRAGLMVTSTFTVGYDVSVAKVFNKPYFEPKWTAGTNGNWEKTCLYYAIHSMQEWAVLPQWLPAVYEAETGGRK